MIIGLKLLQEQVWGDSVIEWLSLITLAVGFSTGIVTIYKHYECGEPTCHRPSKHHYIDSNGKKHQLCHKHDVYKHPKGPHWWSKRKGHSLEEIHSMIGKPEIPLQ